MSGRPALKPLVRCPNCTSGFIYPIRCVSWDRSSVLERRCPECEHRGVVVTNALAAAVWRRRNDRAGDEMLALADAVADGLEMEGELSVLDTQRGRRGP